MKYQYPFLYVFREWGMKPSLIAFFLFCLVLVMWWFVNKGECKLDAASWQTADRRRRIVALSLGFLLGLPLVAFLARADGELLPAKLAAAFLKYETLFSCGLLLICVIGLICIDKNQLSFLRVIVRGADILLGLSVFSTVAVGQIELDEHGNWALLLALGAAFAALAVCDVKPIKREGAEPLPAGSPSFEPIESFAQLLPERQVEATQLVDLLANAPKSPLSICVNGGWGSGKTSVVNGALEKLAGAGDKYEVIRINAMEMDTQESLISYVFDQIKQCLKKRGAYVGPGSEYRAVVTSLLKTATDASVATLIESELFPAADDYRSRKKQLEELVSAIMQDGRIIIVLDDIERCAPDKAKQFVYFTKEIATMDCCAIIFITDYPQLAKALPDYDAGDSSISAEYSFYEKFFNYRIDLGGLDIPRAIRTLDNNRVYLKTHYYVEFKRPPTMYTHICERLEAGLKKREERLEKANDDESRVNAKKAVDEQNKLRERFSDALDNPRKLAKLFHKLETYCHTIDQKFAEMTPVETGPYFKLIRLDEILFALAYIDVCIPGEAKALQLQSRKYFETFWKNNNSADKQLIATLLDGVLLTPSIFGNHADVSYEQRKARRLVETFFRHPDDLDQTIDPFMRQEDEWLHALDEGDDEMLKRDWLHIFETVIKAPFAVSKEEQPAMLQTANSRIQKLLEYARDKVMHGEWSGDKAFSFFESAYRFDHFLSQELCIMDAVLQILGTDEVLKTATYDTEKKLASFSEQYAYSRMVYATNLLYFYTQSADSGERQVLTTAHERFLFNAPINRRISEYFAQFNYLRNPPSRYKSVQSDAFLQLDALADEIEAFLKQNGLMEFPDVREELALMRRSTQDMRAFATLQERIKNRVGVDSSMNADSVRTGDIDEVIAYFENALKHPENVDSTAFQFNFSALFDRIRDDAELKLDASQLEKLHQIATAYCQATSRKPLPYRKILMDYSNQRDTAHAAAPDPAQ